MYSTLILLQNFLNADVIDINVVVGFLKTLSSINELGNYPIVVQIIQNESLLNDPITVKSLLDIIDSKINEYNSKSINEVRKLILDNQFTSYSNEVLSFNSIHEADLVDISDSVGKDRLKYFALYPKQYSGALAIDISVPTGIPKQYRNITVPVTVSQEDYKNVTGSEGNDITFSYVYVLEFELARSYHNDVPRNKVVISSMIALGLDFMDRNDGFSSMTIPALTDEYTFNITESGDVDRYRVVIDTRPSLERICTSYNDKYEYDMVEEMKRTNAAKETFTYADYLGLCYTDKHGVVLVPQAFYVFYEHTTDIFHDKEFEVTNPDSNFLNTLVTTLNMNPEIFVNISQNRQKLRFTMLSFKQGWEFSLKPYVMVLSSNDDSRDSNSGNINTEELNRIIGRFNDLGIQCRFESQNNNGKTRSYLHFEGITFSHNTGRSSDHLIHGLEYRIAAFERRFMDACQTMCIEGLLKPDSGNRSYAATHIQFNGKGFKIKMFFSKMFDKNSIENHIKDTNRVKELLFRMYVRDSGENIKVNGEPVFFNDIIPGSFTSVRESRTNKQGSMEIITTVYPINFSFYNMDKGENFTRLTHSVLNFTEIKHYHALKLSNESKDHNIISIVVSHKENLPPVLSDRTDKPIRVINITTNKTLYLMDRFNSSLKFTDERSYEILDLNNSREIVSDGGAVLRVKIDKPSGSIFSPGTLTRFYMENMSIRDDELKYFMEIVRLVGDQTFTIKQLIETQPRVKLSPLGVFFKNLSVLIVDNHIDELIIFLACSKNDNSSDSRDIFQDTCPTFSTFFTKLVKSVANPIFNLGLEPVTDTLIEMIRGVMRKEEDTVMLEFDGYSPDSKLSGLGKSILEELKPNGEEKGLIINVEKASNSIVMQKWRDDYVNAISIYADDGSGRVQMIDIDLINRLSSLYSFPSILSQIQKYVSNDDYTSEIESFIFSVGGKNDQFIVSIVDGEYFVVAKNELTDVLMGKRHTVVRSGVEFEFEEYKSEHKIGRRSHDSFFDAIFTGTFSSEDDINSEIMNFVNDHIRYFSMGTLSFPKVSDVSICSVFPKTDINSIEVIFCLPFYSNGGQLILNRVVSGNVKLSTKSCFITYNLEIVGDEIEGEISVSDDVSMIEDLWNRGILDVDSPQFNFSMLAGGMDVSSQCPIFPEVQLAIMVHSAIVTPDYQFDVGNYDARYSLVPYNPLSLYAYLISEDPQKAVLIIEENRTKLKTLFPSLETAEAVYPSDILSNLEIKEGDVSVSDQIVISTMHDIKTKNYGVPSTDRFIPSFNKQFGTLSGYEAPSENFGKNSFSRFIGEITDRQLSDIHYQIRDETIQSNITFASDQLRRGIVSVNKTEFKTEYIKWYKLSPNKKILAVATNDYIQVYIRANDQYVHCSSLYHEDVDKIVLASSYGITVSKLETKLWLLGVGVHINIEFKPYKFKVGDIVDANTGTALQVQKLTSVPITKVEDDNGKPIYFHQNNRLKDVTWKYDTSVFFFSPNERFLAFNDESFLKIYNIVTFQMVEINNLNGAVGDVHLPMVVDGKWEVVDGNSIFYGVVIGNESRFLIVDVNASTASDILLGGNSLTQVHNNLVTKTDRSDPIIDEISRHGEIIYGNWLFDVFITIDEDFGFLVLVKDQMMYKISARIIWDNSDTEDIMIFGDGDVTLHNPVNFATMILDHCDINLDDHNISEIIPYDTTWNLLTDPYHIDFAVPRIILNTEVIHVTSTQEGYITVGYSKIGTRVVTSISRFCENGRIDYDINGVVSVLPYGDSYIVVCFRDGELCDADLQGSEEILGNNTESAITTMFKNPISRRATTFDDPLIVKNRICSVRYQQRGTQINVDEYEISSRLCLNRYDRSVIRTIDDPNFEGMEKKVIGNLALFLDKNRIHIVPNSVQFADELSTMVKIPSNVQNKFNEQATVTFEQDTEELRMYINGLDSSYPELSSPSVEITEVYRLMIKPFGFWTRGDFISMINDRTSVEFRDDRMHAQDIRIRIIKDRSIRTEMESFFRGTPVNVILHNLYSNNHEDQDPEIIKIKSLFPEIKLHSSVVHNVFMELKRMYRGLKEGTPIYSMVTSDTDHDVKQIAFAETFFPQGDNGSLAIFFKDAESFRIQIYKKLVNVLNARRKMLSSNSAYDEFKSKPLAMISDTLKELLVRYYAFSMKGFTAGSIFRGYLTEDYQGINLMKMSLQAEDWVIMKSSSKRDAEEESNRFRELLSNLMNLENEEPEDPEALDLYRIKKDQINQLVVKRYENMLDGKALKKASETLASLRRDVSNADLRIDEAFTSLMEAISDFRGSSNGGILDRFSNEPSLRLPEELDTADSDGEIEEAYESERLIMSAFANMVEDFSSRSVPNKYSFDYSSYWTDNMEYTIDNYRSLMEDLFESYQRNSSRSDEVSKKRKMVINAVKIFNAFVDLSDMVADRTEVSERLTRYKTTIDSCSSRIIEGQKPFSEILSEECLMREGETFEDVLSRFDIFTRMIVDSRPTTTIETPYGTPISFSTDGVSREIAAKYGPKTPPVNSLATVEIPEHFVITTEYEFMNKITKETYIVHRDRYRCDSYRDFHYELIDTLDAGIKSSNSGNVFLKVLSILKDKLRNVINIAYEGSTSALDVYRILIHQEFLYEFIEIVEDIRKRKIISDKVHSSQDSFMMTYHELITMMSEILFKSLPDSIHEMKKKSDKSNVERFNRWCERLSDETIRNDFEWMIDKISNERITLTDLENVVAREITKILTMSNSPTSTLEERTIINEKIAFINNLRSFKMLIPEQVQWIDEFCQRSADFRRLVSIKSYLIHQSGLPLVWFRTPLFALVQTIVGSDEGPELFSWYLKNGMSTGVSLNQMNLFDDYHVPTIESKILRYLRMISSGHYVSEKYMNAESHEMEILLYPYLENYRNGYHDHNYAKVNHLVLQFPNSIKFSPSSKTLTELSDIPLMYESEERSSRMETKKVFSINLIDIIRNAVIHDYVEFKESIGEMIVWNKDIFDELLKDDDHVSEFSAAFEGKTSGQISSIIKSSGNIVLMSPRNSRNGSTLHKFNEVDPIQRSLKNAIASIQSVEVSLNRVEHGIRLNFGEFSMTMDITVDKYTPSEIIGKIRVPSSFSASNLKLCEPLKTVMDSKYRPGVIFADKKKCILQISNAMVRLDETQNRFTKVGVFVLYDIRNGSRSIFIMKIPLEYESCIVEDNKLLCRKNGKVETYGFEMLSNYTRVFDLDQDTYDGASHYDLKFKQFGEYIVYYTKYRTELNRLEEQKAGKEIKKTIRSARIKRGRAREVTSGELVSTRKYVGEHSGTTLYIYKMVKNGSKVSLINVRNIVMPEMEVEDFYLQASIELDSRLKIIGKVKEYYPGQNSLGAKTRVCMGYINVNINSETETNTTEMITSFSKGIDLKVPTFNRSVSCRIEHGDVDFVSISKNTKSGEDEKSYMVFNSVYGTMICEVNGVIDNIKTCKSEQLVAVQFEDHFEVWNRNAQLIDSHNGTADWY